MTDEVHQVWVERPDNGPMNAYLHSGSWPGDRRRFFSEDRAAAIVAAALAEAAATVPDVHGLSPQMVRSVSDIQEAIRALIPDAGAALDRALEKARAEEREACWDIAKSMNGHTIRHHPKAVETCNAIAAAIRARGDVKAGHREDLDALRNEQAGRVRLGRQAMPLPQQIAAYDWD